MNTKAPTLRQFQAQFPTEEACLDHLFQVRYGSDFNCPKCERPAKYSRVKARRAYQCNWCANQFYPTAGTPFDRTRTSLRDWFYVMFLYTTSRNGVAAKRVQREIGVTYKTAWRMCDQIRQYMTALDSDDSIGGEGECVQFDESFIGGKGKRHNLRANKKVVIGMVEQGGELLTRVVASTRKLDLLPQVQAFILPGTEVRTDESSSYRTLHNLGFTHKKVNRSVGGYVSADGCTVNALVGFWDMLKRGLYGTHISVSAKHLPKYLSEFEYRWNMRHTPHLMLDRLLYSFTR